MIAEITGTTMPKRSAEQIVRDGAVDFESFYAARTADALGPAAGEILVGAIDCKGFPMVKPDGAQRIVRRSKGEKANGSAFEPTPTVARGDNTKSTPGSPYVGTAIVRRRSTQGAVTRIRSCIDRRLASPPRRYW